MTTTTKLFTLAEYLSYDDGTDRRYELVNGELKEMPSESDLNNAIAIFLLLAFAKVVPGLLLRRGTEIAVSGSRATVRVPDLLILTEELVTALAETTRSIITPDMPPPALVVEVVSPGKENQDRDYRYKRCSAVLGVSPMSDCIKKRSEYAARGIKEYWLVDPKQAQVIILTLVDGLYEEAIFRNEDCLVSQMFDNLELTANQVLQIEIA